MLRITAVWAEGTVNLNLTASKAADNKKITVTISSNSNIDIQSMSMSLQYPNEWITPVSVSNQKGEQVSLSSDYAGNSGTVGLSLNAADKAIGSGSLCTVTFDVHQTFEKDTAIAFQLAVGTVLDSQGQAVKASAHGASVTVAAHAFSSQTSSTDNPTLSLNKTQITLSANETFQLVATIKSETAANHKVTYQSSDTSIVTVDAKGKITALKQGKATVTASLSGGNTAKCVVTVKPKIKEIILQKKKLKSQKAPNIR